MTERRVERFDGSVDIRHACAESNLTDKEKIPTGGYNFQATNDICSQIALKDPDCGFVDAFSFVLDKYTNNSEYVDGIIEGGSGKKKAIIGEAQIFAKEQTLLDPWLADILERMFEKNTGLGRVVMPLTLVDLTGEKESHGVALCIDRKDNNTDIIILEQHAFKDKKEEGYDGKLDFSSEIEAILTYLEEFFTQKNPGATVNTYTNKKPFCREKGVCSVVSLEACRRLLSAENPVDIINQKAGEKGAIGSFNSNDVARFHRQNFKLLHPKDKQIDSQNPERGPLSPKEGKSSL